MFDMTTTARLRLGNATTARSMPSQIKTDPGMPAPRPPARRASDLDVSMVAGNGCPFCDDGGCSECGACGARPSRRAVGTIAPDTETETETETDGTIINL